MTSLLVPWLLACASPQGSSPGDDTSRPPDFDPVDVELSSAPEVDRVDVLVIGAGSAGLSAVWAASEAGAKVLALEMEDNPGGSAWFASNFFAAGTAFQKELGHVDSAEQALEDWAEITGGGDASDPMVQQYVLNSAELVEWLVAISGVDVLAVTDGSDMGDKYRDHMIPSQRYAPALVDLLGEHVRTQARADELVMSGGRVVGARWTDLSTGDKRVTLASAVVVATGGFARNMDLLAQELPEVTEHTTVFEAALVVHGGGHDMLDEVHAARHNEGTYGMYAHSTADHRDGYEGEALWMPTLSDALIVDLDGQRVANEDDTRRFVMYETLTAAPEARLFALFDLETFDEMVISVPAYNWASLEEREDHGSDFLFDGEWAVQAADAEQLAIELGIDPDALAATIEDYESIIAAGEDAEFGKSLSNIHKFGEDPITSVELFGGSAKAFTGFRTDTSTRVLDEDGEAIPGLYGAGEVIGMLGTDAVGEGFGGAVGACMYTGLLAGQNAATEALASPKPRLR